MDWIAFVNMRSHILRIIWEGAMPQPFVTEIKKLTCSYKDYIIENEPMDCMHYHDGYELVLSAKASNECFLKDTGYDFSDRTLIFVPVRQVHIIKYKKGTNYVRYVANFLHDEMQGVLAALGAPNILSDMSNMRVLAIKLSPQQYLSMSALFHELYTGANKGEEFMPTAKGYLSILIMEAYKLLKEGQNRTDDLKARPSKLVRDAVNYIDNNFSNPITLDALAGMLFVSKYYLCHMFTQVTGSGIVDYIQLRRVIEAQKLLMMGGVTNQEVARRCGFNNMQHFYRVFKKVTGYSPGNYKLPDQ
ncbi:MAG: helix-turn-helix domain-containing protein [Clostridiales bacterium]|nr:helix-turn-helix domain-containing protein [Clostridiales bacterium]